MLSKAFQKFAAQYGLVCSHGIAYGIYRGYMLSLIDGAGVKNATFTVHFRDQMQQDMMSGFLSHDELRKDYRLRTFSISEDTVALCFNDTFGTMPKVEKALDLVVTQLLTLGVSGAQCCTCCGQPFQEAPKSVLFDDAVYLAHETCAMQWSNAQDLHRKAVRSGGSLLTGWLGALLGALVASVVWGFAYYNDYFVSIIGLLVGFCSSWAYDKLGGRQTGAKIVAVIVCTVFSIVLAQFTAEVLGVVNAFGCSLGEGIDLTFAILEQSSEALSGFVKNLLMGLFFAGLGIVAVILNIRAKTKNNSSRPQIIG